MAENWQSDSQEIRINSWNKINPLIRLFIIDAEKNIIDDSQKGSDHPAMECFFNDSIPP